MPRSELESVLTFQYHFPITETNVTVARYYLPVNLRMVMYYRFFLCSLVLNSYNFSIKLQYKMERKVYYEII